MQKRLSGFISGRKHGPWFGCAATGRHLLGLGPQSELGCLLQFPLSVFLSCFLAPIFLLFLTFRLSSLGFILCLLSLPLSPSLLYLSPFVPPSRLPSLWGVYIATHVYIATYGKVLAGRHRHRQMEALARNNDRHTD